MKSLLEYRTLFKTLLDDLNIKGDSAEILRQLFAYSTYISEVENASYLRESSLEKATLLNSKIQHCINEMYSVYRGSCPRVVLNITPTKILNYSKFDKITTSNSFGVFYLGYYQKSEDSGESKFVYSGTTLMPGETYTIIGALAKQTHSGSYTFNENDFFVNFTEPDLSNDVLVVSGGQECTTTRNFSDHTMNGDIFDLTLTDFGSRLYLVNSTAGSEPSTTVTATYLKYSYLSTYNTSELERLTIKGAKLEPFEEGWIDSMGYSEETKPGVVYIQETPRDTIGTIHYKAYRERFTSSLFRSNNDIGALLESSYPDQIATNGTSFRTIVNEETGETSLNIYYIPEGGGLSEEDKRYFIENRSPYFINGDLKIQEGEKYTADLYLGVVLYRSGSIESELEDILKNYTNKFGIDLVEKPDEKNSMLEELKSSISKISNVRWISEMSFRFFDKDGNEVASEEDLNAIDPDEVYFGEINHTTATSIE